MSFINYFDLQGFLFFRKSIVYHGLTSSQSFVSLIPSSLALHTRNFHSWTKNGGFSFFPIVFNGFLIFSNGFSLCSSTWSLRWCPSTSRRRPMWLTLRRSVAGGTHRSCRRATKRHLAESSASKGFWSERDTKMGENMIETVNLVSKS